MINVPTELLRTLVAVVDLRSFTKAANSLGVTQPAVSAQIKRLQLLLDCDLFDKSAPGVSLTPSGELVVNYARRMLNINDQIIELSMPRLSRQSLRVGVPGDFVAPYLPPVLAKFKSQHPDVRVAVRSDRFDNMLRDLRQGELDLMVGLSEVGIMLDARHQWLEPTVWVRNPEFELDANAPVPLAIFGEAWAIHRATLAALNRANQAFDIVFIASSEASVISAVEHKLGVSALARSRAMTSGLEVWEDAPLPSVGDLYCGIYLGENAEQALLEELADAIFDVIGPKSARRGSELMLKSPGLVGRR